MPEYRMPEYRMLPEYRILEYRIPAAPRDLGALAGHHERPRLTAGRDPTDANEDKFGRQYLHATFASHLQSQR